MDTLVTILGWVLVIGLVRQFGRAIFGTQRDCLTCGRWVPVDEALVPRRDFQICHTCVSDGTARTSAMREGRPDEAGVLADRCEFCSHEATRERPVVMLPRAAMCSDCLQTCRDLLEEEAAEAKAAAADASGPPASEDGSARTRPIRVVRIFRLGGFRWALRAGVLGLDDPRAYGELEHAIAKAFVLLAAHPVEKWLPLSSGGFDLAVPRLGDRSGYIEVGYGGSGEVADVVVLEACLPFRFWPFGGWVAVDARRHRTDGTMHYLTQEELERMW